MAISNYDVPSAGDYSAPTPHAAQVAQEPFVAPSGNSVGEGAQVAHGGFDAAQSAPHWSGTPGESAEAPEISPGGGWNETT